MIDWQMFWTVYAALMAFGFTVWALCMVEQIVGRWLWRLRDAQIAARWKDTRGRIAMKIRSTEE